MRMLSPIRMAVSIQFAPGQPHPQWTIMRGRRVRETEPVKGRQTNMTPSVTSKPSRLSRNELLVLLGLSGSLFVYQLLTAALSPYGYFIDELYYIACSKRLAFGYVDHPPLAVFLLALSRAILGESVTALRVLPALALSTSVFITGLIARRLGGGLPAMVLAAVGAILAPDYLLMGSFYSTNAFEIVIWTAIAYLTIRMVQENEPRWWLAIGLLLGLGLQTKHTIVLYSVALVVGMLLTGARRLLFTRWFLAGMLTSVLLTLPNLVWQYSKGFPSLEFYKNATLGKNIPTGPLDVLQGQFLIANRFALPLWIAGLFYLLFRAPGKRYRFLGLCYLVLVLIMVLGGSSRPDRIAAIYTVLFAAGAVFFEDFGRVGAKRYAGVAVLIIMTFGGLVFLPAFSPVLPPAMLQSYLSAIGFSFSVEIGKTDEPLPQWIADRLGWRELASDVSEVCRSLPPEERREAILVSTNYGEAGALELYGPEFGLPPVFATHNSYHDWGPPSDSVRTYVVVFADREDLERQFDSVVEAAVHTCGYCTRPQRRIPIYVARGPRFSVKAAWPSFKNYN